jgi:hypothetical protein
MLTACCQHKRNQGRPYLHNKDVIVQHLRLLFAHTPEVLIDDYGSVKDWHREAMHEQYWTQLIQCLLDNQAPTPPRPTSWPPPRRRSPRTNGPHPSPTAPSNDPTSDSPPVPSPPRRRPPPPPPRHQQQQSNYDPALVHSLEHSLRALGLGLGASEIDVRVAYRALARIYHPDKHDPAQTGLTNEQAADYFKVINNAQAYLREVL